MNQCPKIPKNNLISKYISYAFVCFILYIIIIIVGIRKKVSLYFSFIELLFLLLFLIFNWFHLLGILIISIIFFNLIRLIFDIGLLIQNEVPFNNNIFIYCYYLSFILLDATTINILFSIRKEGKALLLEQNEDGTELEDIPNNNYYKSKDNNNKSKTKKGYIPFSGKGTVVG